MHPIGLRKLERSRAFRYLVVPGATAVVVLALFASAAGTQAAPKIAKPVTVATLSGSGSTEDVGNFPNDGDEYAIQLNGANTFSFTQPGNAAVELILTLTDGQVHWSNNAYPAAFCEGTVYVYDDAAQLGARLDLPDQRGDVHFGYPGNGMAVGGTAAPGTDRTVTLHAGVLEAPGCDADSIDEPTADDDWWTVSIRVSVVILQGA